MLLSHIAYYIPIEEYKVGIDGVGMAFRPTEPLRRHDQSHNLGVDAAVCQLRDVPAPAGMAGGSIKTGLLEQVAHHAPPQHVESMPETFNT
jgi:hypothetical protein